MPTDLHQDSAWPLILASSSPRRKELMQAAGYRFTVMPPLEPDECGLCSGENPAQFVCRVAAKKALDTAARVQRGIVIGCDTVAECLGQILGKPHDDEHARKMLQLLRGRVHHVYSGLCLIAVPDGTPHVHWARTTLKMDPLTDAQMDDYLATGLWEGKAGAFGYQDGIDWVHVVEGSESNVVGLPMELLAEILRGMGIVSQA